MGQHPTHDFTHTWIVGPHAEIGQGAELVDGVAGVVVPLERATRPGGGLGDEGLYLRVGQHLGAGGPHLGVVLGPVEQIYQCAVAGPGFVGFQ